MSRSPNSPIASVVLLALSACTMPVSSPTPEEWESRIETSTVWSEDGAALLVEVHRWEEQQRSSWLSSGRVQRNHSFEYWTVEPTGADAALVMSSDGRLHDVYFQRARGYLIGRQERMDGFVAVRVRLDGTTDEIGRGWTVPNPAGDLILVAAPQSGCDDTSCLVDLTLVNANDLTTAVGPAVATVGAIGGFVWLDDDEVRFGSASLFRDGRLATGLPTPTCDLAPTASGPWGRDGALAIATVNATGDGFSIATRADPPGWPARCAPAP